MNRIATLAILAITLLVALPAVAQTDAPADAASLMTAQNALYASARAVRDQMNDLRDSGLLGTEAGQARMEALTAELSRIEAEVRAVREARKTLIAERRSERLRSSRTVALRDRSDSPAPPPANASR